MIRKLLNGDIDRVADIWLKTNLKAHYFISNQYWKSNYELVKEMMSQSEVYVFEVDKMIQGFKNKIIYVFLTIFLYLLKCPQSLILSALRAFCFCGKPHISRSIFLYFRYQSWLKSW